MTWLLGRLVAAEVGDERTRAAIPMPLPPDQPMGMEVWLLPTSLGDLPRAKPMTPGRPSRIIGRRIPSTLDPTISTADRRRPHYVAPQCVVTLRVRTEQHRPERSSGRASRMKPDPSAPLRVMATRGSMRP